MQRVAHHNGWAGVDRDRGGQAVQAGPVRDLQLKEYRFQRRFRVSESDAPVALAHQSHSERRVVHVRPHLIARSPHRANRSGAKVVVKKSVS